MDKYSMERKDSTSIADVYALSKMDPLAKRAENTQVILMYERLSAGKKTIGEVFDKMVGNTVELGTLDMRLTNCTQSIFQELNGTRQLLTDMQEQQEKIRNLEEQVRISQSFFKEALDEAKRENKNIRRLCNDAIRQENASENRDVSSYQELKEQMAEMQKTLDEMTYENRQLGKNLQEMMEYVRIYHSGISTLQKKNDMLLDVKQDMKKVADKNLHITKSFAQLSSQMGKLAQDRFYMLDNAMFKSILSSAVICHKEWMRGFRRYVDTGKDVDLQFDWKLSGFGICYLSVYPKHQDIDEEWLEIGKLHEEIHKLACTSIPKVEKGELEKARMVYEKAKDLSEILLGHIDYIVKKIKTIEKKKQNVFEKY